MNFLTPYQVKTDNYNHVLLTAPFGKFNIPDDPSIVNKLHTYIKNCYDNGVDLGLCEVHDEELDELLYYDLDLSLKEAIDVDDTIIINFVKLVNNVISKLLTVHSNYLTSFVMKKQNPIELKKCENYWHVGIHIMYPYIRLNYIGRQIIYDKIIKALKKDNCFSGLPLFEEKLEEIVDHRVIKTNPILLFGCNKKEKQRYNLYKVYDSNLTELNTQNYSFKDLLNLTSLRYNLRNEPIVCHYKETIDIDKLAEEVLFKYFYKKETVTKNNKQNDKKITTETLEKIKRVVNLLSVQRASIYDEWIKVGLCLHNICDSEEMLTIWKDWSTICKTKANKTNFNKIWKSFKQRNDGLKFGSLTLWAKQDNETGFLKFKLDEIDRKLRTSLEDNTPYDIAKVLREMYDGIYVCSSIKHKQWYEYRNHRYVEIQEGYTLFINISEELVHEYHRKHLELDEERVSLKKKSFEQGNCNELEEKIKNIISKMNAITKLIEKLKDTNFKNKIMAESRNLFYDENFENKLNEYRHLIVFNNGVYDLDKKEFRNGRPEDYMSFCTNNNYIEFNEHDPDIQKIFYLFSQIHPDEVMRHFFFTTLAAGLHGYKKEQKIDIWTGSGSNGKSLTSDFVAKALGDFYDSPSITLLTRKRGGSAQASPDLVKLKGKRINFFLEPEYHDTLHSSMLKQLTGNDWIEGRGLFKDFIKFKPQSSYFLACNDLPTIESNDGGTWRRIRVLEFKSKFVKKPTKPNEYKIDITLQEQIEQLSEAFMSVLIYYWNKFTLSGFIINEPPEVLEFTRKYQSNSDLYLEFINENIEDYPGEKLIYQDVWAQFKDWIKSAYPNIKCSNKPDVKNQLESKLGIYKSGWADKRLREPNDIL
jgi:P4 family phage/plasmid primase-like protien